MCSSPSTTVGIFRCLVMHHDQVDVHKAVTAGSNAVRPSSAALKIGDTNKSSSNSNDSSYSGTSVDNSGHVDNNTTIRNNNSNNEDDSNDKELARMTAQDMLLSLPGINVHNFREVIKHVVNLSDLFDLSEAKMCELIGSVNGKKLFSFINQCH